MSKCCVLFFILVVYGFFSSFFIVNEGERSIILRYGKIVKNAKQETVVYTPGYHFKWPILEVVKIFNVRIRNITNESEHFFTKDNNEVIINSYLEWYIKDFSKYYLGTMNGDVFQANDLLKNELNNQLRTIIRTLDAKEIVVITGEKLMQEALNTLNTSNNSLKGIGVKIIDVRITNISFPIHAHDLISHRMQLEKKIIKNSYWSNQENMTEKLRLTADHNISIILLKAYKRSLIVKYDAEKIVKQLFLRDFYQTPNIYFL